MKQNFSACGRVEWIGIRTRKRQAMQVLSQVQAIEAHGLEGDHASGRTPNGKRQVTLIQAEHLPVIQTLANSDCEPGQLRRNLSVSGINIRALIGQQFQVGQAVLEGTGTCAPCGNMERTLGFGGFNAMRGMGGVTARVVQSGQICLQDKVGLVNNQRELI